MPKASKAKKQQRAAERAKNEAAAAKVPRSMVFYRGKTGESTKALVGNLRKVFGPYTAMKLDKTANNTLKDFLGVAPGLGVSHFVMLNNSEKGTGLRICKVLNGPSLSYRVLEYSLMSDITHMQKKPHSPGAEMNESPLVVMNNFKVSNTLASEAPGKNTPANIVKLQVAMLQSMFPALDLGAIDVKKSCRRVVLFHYDQKNETIQIRHYVIKLTPVGVHKVVKKLAAGKIPHLSNLEDISQILEEELGLSDTSGGEEAVDAHVQDIQKEKKSMSYSQRRKGDTSGKSAVRLKEVGPRVTMQLMRMEEGFLTGEVLYSRHSKMTKEQQQELKQRKQQEKLDKKRRKEIQEANVAAKQKKNKKVSVSSKGYIPNDDMDDDNDMNDADWYREQVGETAQPGMFDLKQKNAAPSNAEKRFEQNRKKATERRAERDKKKEVDRNNGVKRKKPDKAPSVKGGIIRKRGRK